MQLQQVHSVLQVGDELRKLPSDGGYLSCSSSFDHNLAGGRSSSHNLAFLQGDRRKTQKAFRHGGFTLQSASSGFSAGKTTQKALRHGGLASSSLAFDRARNTHKSLRYGGFVLKSPAAAKNLLFLRKCAAIGASASDEAGNEENAKKKKPKSENEQLPVVVSVAEKLRPDHVYVRQGAVSPITVEEIQKDKQTRHKQQSPLEKEAWSLLRGAMVYYCGSPCGTIAANDPSDSHPLNYDQVFIRDFIPSAIAFLLKGEPDVVRNFLLHTLQLQSWEKTVDCYNPGQGLIPASFKVRTVPLEGDHSNATEEVLDPDFGEAAIGRVAPVDSGLWWIILLRAYGKSTGDYSLQERVDVQTGMKMILKLCLADGFDMFPTLLVTDGSCMIDRRMGIHGHPLEIQALFYSALRCAREMLIPEDSLDLLRAITSRLSALSFHIREYYWVDMRKLNEIYRYKTEEYSHDAVNKFNIYPDHLSPWLADWIPNKGGYLVGNLQPAHMDFRFFSLGNLWAIVGSLATPEQAEGILDLIEARWTDFVGNMPLKICFPALTGEEWRIITGSDPKNTPWSYHNGGSWPTLLWQLTVACIKMGRPEMAQRAIEVAEKRISRDRWPEYYDTRAARFIGKQARLYQTWSVAGYLTAKMLLDNPEAVKLLTCEEDLALLEAMSCSLDANPRLKRTRKLKSTRIII